MENCEAFCGGTRNVQKQELLTLKTPIYTKKTSIFTSRSASGQVVQRGRETAQAIADDVIAARKRTVLTSQRHRQVRGGVAE